MVSRERIVELQSILEKEHGRSFSFEEANEIGNGLVRLYESLADNALGIGHTKGCKHCKNSGNKSKNDGSTTQR